MVAGPRGLQPTATAATVADSLAASECSDPPEHATILHQGMGGGVVAMTRLLLTCEQ